MRGREALAKPYPFVSKVHIIGRAITAQEDEELYIKLSRWDNTSVSGRAGYWSCKKFYDSFWAETYRELKKLLDVSPPDFIFSDFQAEAPKDVAIEYSISLAEMWPQMPWLMAPQPWIPGMVGAQVRCLTSEHASMYDRIFEQTHMLRDAPNLIDYYLWARNMRRKNGVRTMPFLKPKPDHVVLINSFIGSEIPKDLPPLMMVAGPILSDDWRKLDQNELQFLENKKTVVYFALGTHVILETKVLGKILLGLDNAMKCGHIDGIIWAVRKVARKQFIPLENLTISSLEVSDLIQNKHGSWLFLDNAPQRAVLDHPSCKLFFTHCGPSSANEALYHGVPQLCMGIYGDQLPRVMRLVNAGVALSIEKLNFSAAEVTEKVRIIIQDSDGNFARNTCRMQRIAHVASRRKHAAADLIEEHMYDWELRFEHPPTRMLKTGDATSARRGKELSPMHLQTADMRMSRMKTSNMDQKLIMLGILAALTYVFKVFTRNYTLI